MTEYSLYVESGPRKRKTMVHVLDLLGCIAQGPTTEAALENTPDAIRRYLRFLQANGEPIDAEAPFTTAIATHVMEGPWLGNGDPTSGFAPDFQPLTAVDLSTYLRWLGYIQETLIQRVSNLSPEQLDAQPSTGGRPIRKILEHIASSQYSYFQSPLTKPGGIAQALRLVEDGFDSPLALTLFWEVAGNHLASLPEEERAALVQHGQKTWTAKRGIRRMLEHAWEHLEEIREHQESAQGQT